MIGHRMAFVSAACATLLVVGAGCRSTPRVTGAYELRAVNQQPLPYRGGAVAGTSVEITGGTLALHADGSYERRLVFITHTGSSSYADSTVQRGKYERRMSTIVMHTAGGDEPADLVGPALVMSIRGWRYLFRQPGQ